MSGHVLGSSNTVHVYAPYPGVGIRNSASNTNLNTSNSELNRSPGSALIASHLGIYSRWMQISIKERNRVIVYAL